MVENGNITRFYKVSIKGVLVPDQGLVDAPAAIHGWYAWLSNEDCFDPDPFRTVTVYADNEEMTAHDTNMGLVEILNEV